MAPDADLSEPEELGSKATPAELLSRVRTGDLDAVYELLGRQASVKAWREALSQLAKVPDRADLEVAAHRALRRPQEVVSALVDLAEVAATTRAAFVARAVASLRSEEHLVGRANELRDQLLRASDLELLLAAESGHDALYFTLAHDLADRPRLLDLVASDPDSSRMFAAALDREYQRLLELGRTVRWTSGSYRYLLRHSLADVALLSRASGRTFELAYRLLQQQVDNPEENHELLDLLPPETRRTFLQWALERENLGRPADAVVLGTSDRESFAPPTDALLV